jgi:uncharacterized protein (TIGR03663 family)
MERAAFGLVFAGALALALAFRLAEPGARPMHHDEANQAFRFGILLETGEYHYDRTDHHGPTLYYLTLPAAWLRGQHTLAALDERTLRLVPAAFGVATILLFLLLAPDLGRAAVGAAAILAALSPIAVYYSRFYVQEMIFVFFTLAFAIALGRYVQRPKGSTACWTGALAGLAYATKETSIIVLPAAVVACAVAAIVTRRGSERVRAAPRDRAVHALAALAAAAAPALLLYSAFFRNRSGPLSSVTAFSIYFSRGVEAGPHVQPWYAYLQMLAWSYSEGVAWSEALVLMLAAIGIGHALARRRTSFWPLYIAVYSIVTLAIFSVIRYKTPWNALPFYVGFFLLGGIGVSTVLARLPNRIACAAIVAALVGGCWHLGIQAVRASIRYAAYPRNPYVYAHTSPDFLRLAARVHDVAAVHPDGRAMLVKVIAGPYEQWPLPWYVRDLTRVGYWTRPEDAGPLDAAPVVVAAQEHAAAVEAALGDRYVSEFYGLRPGVLLSVFIERGLWERFLETRQ